MMRLRLKQWILAVSVCTAVVIPTVCGDLRAQGDTPDANGAPKAAPVAPMTTECKAALAAAKAIAEEAKGVKGPERLAILERAAKACEQVLADHADDVWGTAQAAWEAGELWRRHGSLEAAHTAYVRAVALHPGRWAERAGCGAADMLRRQKKMEEALEAYRKVVALGTDTNRAHDARVYVARCLDATDQQEAALTAYREALAAATRPRQVIDAGNWLAKALVQRGDLDGAQGVLDQVAQTVNAAEADAVERERLDKALEGMSARRLLQRVRDKTNGADRDAVDVDRSRRG